MLPKGHVWKRGGPGRALLTIDFESAEADMGIKMNLQKNNIWRKLAGDRAFYKMVLGVAVPIMIQNGITNFVGLLDNIMVGRIGTEQMSGIAIVNQLAGV